MKLTLLTIVLIVLLFGSNILNAWSRPDSTGIAINNVGGIDTEGLFVCTGGRVNDTYYSNPLADLFPSLVVDC